MPIALKNQIKQYDIFIQKENVHPPYPFLYTKFPPTPHPKITHYFQYHN